MQRLSAHRYLCVLLFFGNGLKVSLTPFVLAFLRLRDPPTRLRSRTQSSSEIELSRVCFFFSSYIYFTCQVCEGSFIKAQSRLSVPHLIEKKIWLGCLVARQEVQYCTGLLHSCKGFEKQWVSVCYGRQSGVKIPQYCILYIVRLNFLVSCGYFFFFFHNGAFI